MGSQDVHGTLGGSICTTRVCMPIFADGFARSGLPCVRPCREDWSQSALISAPSASSARSLRSFAAGFPVLLDRLLRLVARLGLPRIPSKPPTRADAPRDSLPRHAPKRCCVSVYSGASTNKFSDSISVVASEPTRSCPRVRLGAYFQLTVPCLLRRLLKH